MAHHPQISLLAKSRVTANAPLVAVLTGGIYMRKELKRSGLTPTYFPSSYTGGKLKPVCIISHMNPVKLGVSDPENQYGTYRTILSFRLYQHGDSGHDVLETAANMLYDLFNELPLPSCFETIHVNDPIVDGYAEDLQGAAWYKADYSVRYAQYV